MPGSNLQLQRAAHGWAFVAPPTSRLLQPWYEYRQTSVKVLRRRTRSNPPNSLHPRITRGLVLQKHLLVRCNLQESCKG